MLNICERGPGVRQRPAGFVQNFHELRDQCLIQKKNNSQIQNLIHTIYLYFMISQKMGFSGEDQK